MSSDSINNLRTKIPRDWDCKRLSECTTDGNISYGIVQPGQHVENGVPVIRVNNFNNSQLSTDDVLKVSDEIESKYKRTRLFGGEVLLTLVGTTGQSAVVPKSLNGWNIARAIAVIRPLPEIGANWINICLQTKETHQFLDERANTTVQKTLNLADVREIPIPIPPKSIKENIESVAMSLTNKIELNRQTNQTLEQIAQALFKSWFVDFDPVHAKKEGRDTGLPSAIAGLFPSEFVESELGMIPKGWEVSSVGEEVEVVGGGTPSTQNSEYWEDGQFHWTTPKDLSGLPDKILLDTERKITSSGLKNISSGLLPVNTVLMSSRAPVGYLALTKIPTAINQGFIAMKCEKRLPPEYILQWTNSVMDDIKQRSSGSTFAEISKKTFRPIRIVVPSGNLILEFSKTAKIIYDQITELVRQSNSLIEIRDSLLPKLLSGEISV